MLVIIKSGEKNWSGKEFSDLPAKVYASFDDAVSALNTYHFFKYDKKNAEYVPCESKQKIEIIHLSEMQLAKLIYQNRVRL